MIPVGYMYKSVVSAPDWLGDPTVVDLYSVSGCVSRNFADYIQFWRHNGSWMFDRPETIRELAADRALSLSGMTLFYYEVFEQQYEEDDRQWVGLPQDLPFPTSVEPPAARRLEGFDVVTFSCGTTPECSPLSCNSLARKVGVNRHCLLESLDRARQSLQDRLFDHSEPGPFRIFAVHAVPEG